MCGGAESTGGGALTPDLEQNDELGSSEDDAALDMADWLPPAEAAKKGGTSTTSLSRWDKEGIVHAQVVRGARLYSVQEIRQAKALSNARKSETMRAWHAAHPAKRSATSNGTTGPAGKSDSGMPPPASQSHAGKTHEHQDGSGADTKANHGAQRNGNGAGWYVELHDNIAWHALPETRTSASALHILAMLSQIAPEFHIALEDTLRIAESITSIAVDTSRLTELGLADTPIVSEVLARVTRDLYRKRG